MPIAYQEQAQLTCPACGADFDAPIWLILDAQEQPEATAALRCGELNLVACPHCGNSGPAGAPLLFHDAAARRVIFAPAPGAAEHELRDQARDLHALLVGSIPEEQRRPYLADVDIAQDLAGIAHLLERMDRRRRGQGGSGTGQQGNVHASPTPSPQPQPEQSEGPSPAPDPQPPPEQSEASPPPLLLAVEAMLSADSAAELDQALADHPILLDAGTDATLARLAEVAVEQRAFDVAESLRQARSLLGRMAAAAAALRPAAPEAAVVLAPAALQALLQAQSAAELEEVARRHPLLLRPEADALLAERVELALDEGNERLAQGIEERREALLQLRAAEGDGEAGIEASSTVTIDEAIEALLIAEGEEATAEVIDRYPMLLEEAAAQALWQFAAEARAGGDEELARYAVECREMLRRVREELEN